MLNPTIKLDTTRKKNAPPPSSDKPQTVASFETQGGHFLLDGQCGADKGGAQAHGPLL